MKRKNRKQQRRRRQEERASARPADRPGSVAGDRQRVRSGGQGWAARGAGLAIVRVSMLVVVLGLLIWHTRSSVAQIRSSAILLHAETLATTLIRSGQLDQRVLRQEVELLEQAKSLTPRDARIQLALGSYSMLLDRPQRALAWYLESQELNLRPETLLNLARVQARLGKLEESRALYERVVRLDPYRREAVDNELRAWTSSNGQPSESDSR